MFNIPRIAIRSTALSVAFALLATSIPAQAAPATTQDLSTLTNGSETSQVQEALPESDVLKPAQLEAAPPVTGDDNPGATMGQGLKKMSQTANLSEASLKEAQQEVKAAQDGKDVAVSAHEFDSALSDATEQSKEKVTSGAAAVAISPTGSGVLGMDVSGWQPIVDWDGEYSKGARFAYIKATEGDSYASPSFSNQYVGSTEAGMMRGGYHFAIPTLESTGAEQARYFIANGGGWSADGRTLPGLLDIEYNPYSQLGDMCYDLSPAQMRAWIQSFVDEYRRVTGRYPAIYSTANWWNTCTGNSTLFNYLPLHLASYSSTPGAMPSGWTNYDIWQYTDDGPFSGDSNVFNGTLSDLRNFVTVPTYKPKGAPASATMTFRDVPTSHPFYKEITWLANAGISTGWADRTYRPDESNSRAAMAAFLYRLSGSPAYTPPAKSRFKDVPTSHPFYKEISWLAATGITTGWDDGTFRPDENISRAAMGAFLYRLAGSPSYAPTASSAFKDVPTSHPFYKEISWLASSQITTGWSDGTFRAEDAISRAAMAAFIYRYSRIA